MPSPLETFFAQYAPQFQYDPLQAATEEFRRLVEVRGWGGRRMHMARDQFKDALVQQFNASFGRDENSLTGWQALCEVIGIEPIPERVSEAKKIVKSTHVNLVDLTEARLTGTKPLIHPSLAALRRYTLNEADLKIFSKKRAKNSGLLKYLLRPILHRN
ncbi:hypothetical protein FA13DRAFT_1735374 [Coprinellus micaceus]|uniref:Uncharacterized protein n=1 Tax=Coprinellus micaceus TaxID=71717 RepID=A0A4Y7T3V7_COPMI|nr:hypothetical protein FA13DRAFT_1735374 [Coprinellus micaceus]